MCLTFIVLSVGGFPAQSPTGRGVHFALENSITQFQNWNRDVNQRKGERERRKERVKKLKKERNK
jgi:hypothetical protein